MPVMLALYAIVLVGLCGCTRAPADGVPESPTRDDSGEDSPPVDTGPFDLDGDGWLPGRGDCDDTDPTIHSGATEVADGVDQDCDGLVDENTEVSDDDRDGYSEMDGDCDDGDRHTYPGATDYVLCDGIDQSCMGSDEPCESLQDVFAKVVGGGHLARAVAGEIDMTGDGGADVLTFNGSLTVWDIDEDGGQYVYDDRVANVICPLTGNTDMIAVMGDTNRDGWAEVAFGNTSGRQQGYVYILSAPLLGESEVEDVAVATLTDGEESTTFGASVDAGCDANGDGVADILVGAPLDSQNIGRVYLVSGDVRGLVTMDAALATIHGEAENDGVGWGVRFSGDNNGDGVEDILIGGTGFTNRPSQVAWFAGPVTGAYSIADGDLVLNDPERTLIGMAFSEKGDVDGDGREDLVLRTLEESCTGHMYLFTQVPTAGLVEAEARIDGEDSCAVYGWAFDNFGSASTLVDANGDGADDLVVGVDLSVLGASYIEPRASTLYTSGAAALFLAPFSGVRSFWDAEAVWAGEYGADTLGQDVSNAGDFNGDGFEDFLLAAPYYGDPEDSTQAFSGAAYLMLGRADW